MKNLAGCTIPSAERIRPEFQHCEVGDRCAWARKGTPFFAVERIEPGHAVVLRAGTAGGTTAEVRNTWAIVLDEVNQTTTRLVVRSRLDYEPTLANGLMWRAFADPISFVMERKMLPGIQARAEGQR